MNSYYLGPFRYPYLFTPAVYDNSFTAAWHIKNLYILIKDLQKAIVENNESIMNKLIEMINDALDALHNELSDKIEAGDTNLHNLLTAEIDRVIRLIDDSRRDTTVIDSPVIHGMKPLRQVLDEVYTYARDHAVTALEFDLSGLTAEQIDAMGLTAREFDTEGKYHLKYLPDNRVFSAITGSMVTWQEAIAELYCLHVPDSLTAGAQDALGLTAKQIDDKNQTAFQKAPVNTLG